MRCKRIVDGFLGRGISTEKEPDVIRQILRDAPVAGHTYYKIPNMSDQPNHTDPDLERIKSLIVEYIKENGIPINDYWLMFILALFGRKMFNAKEMNGIVKELKERVKENG